MIPYPNTNVHVLKKFIQSLLQSWHVHVRIHLVVGNGNGKASEWSLLTTGICVKKVVPSPVRIRKQRQEHSFK